MHDRTNLALALALAVSVAGCSSGASLLDPKRSVPQASQVQTGNNLALPPDLQLQAPTATSDAYQPNGPVAPVVPAPQPGAAPNFKSAKAVASATPPAAVAGNLYGSAGAAPASPPPGDVFAQYGVSKTNPDGSPKTQQQLNNDLSEAIRRKKREANPSYGTISNIGGLFKDQ